MGRVLARLAVAALLAGFAAGCTTIVSDTGTIPETARSFPASSDGTAIAAVTPPGFTGFCVRFPDQCQAPPGTPATVALTEAAWRTLNQVNSAVNASIWPEDDLAHYGRAEYWTIPTDGYGNCKDYALAKRKDLAAAGFPILALRMAIVITPRQARHAVLTVATDKGDFVLDNLENDIVAWNATGYTWIERQDAISPTSWVSLQPPTMVAANTDLPVGGTTQPTLFVK